MWGEFCFNGSQSEKKKQKQKKTNKKTKQKKKTKKQTKTPKNNKNTKKQNLKESEKIHGYLHFVRKLKRNDPNCRSHAKNISQRLVKKKKDCRN